MCTCVHVCVLLYLQASEPEIPPPPFQLYLHDSLGPSRKQDLREVLQGIMTSAVERGLPPGVEPPKKHANVRTLNSLCALPFMCCFSL